MVGDVGPELGGVAQDLALSVPRGRAAHRELRAASVCHVGARGLSHCGRTMAFQSCLLRSGQV